MSTSLAQWPRAWASLRSCCCRSRPRPRRPPAPARPGPNHVPSPLSPTAVAALGIACTALALYLYFYLINVAGAARASVVAYINPAVAAVIGVLVLQEPFGWGAGVGLVMILFGSY